MTVATRKQTLLAKLGDVSRRIEKILSGQNATLADLPIPEPGETPLERLQRFKRVLNDALSQWNRGEPRNCEKCGGAIADDALDEMPWASRCSACA